jgi:hypothetical protein
LLAHCFKSVVGASGTLSKQNLPYRLEIKSDKKAIAKTLISLAKKHEEVIELSPHESQDILNALSNIAPQVSVLIEVGAALRDYTSLLEIAKKILETQKNREAVVTFDERGLPIILKRGEKRFMSKELVQVDEEKIFWFYAQKDITGTDLKLPPLAEAVVFINEHTTLTEAVQGVGRLRNIHVGQKARFCVDQTSADIIRKELNKADQLTYLDILDYCAKVESLQNNLHSLELQWNALLENRFWDFVDSNTDSGKISKNFQLLRFLMVESTKDDPLARASLFKEVVKIDQALQFLENRFDQKLSRIRTALTQANSELIQYFDSAQLKRERETIKKNMLFPKEVSMNEDPNRTQTTETVADQQQTEAQDVLLDLSGEKENEKEVEQESIQLWSTWKNQLKGRNPLPHNDLIEPSPIEVLFAHENLNEFLPLFSNLFISKNGALTFQGDSLESPGWINGYMKPLHYLFHTDDKKWVLIDESEAALVIKEREGNALWLVNHGFLFSNIEINKEDKETEDKEFAILELKAKIVNGDISFDPNQWRTFKEWVNAERYQLLMRFIDCILTSLHPTIQKSVPYFRLINYGKRLRA